MSTDSATRREHDLLGDRDVPANVYWGVHTLRATENFPITGVSIGRVPEFVRALVLVKKAAALANAELGDLDARRAQAIVQACDEINGGALHDQFVVDVIQGGAGTSSNMNANEVIANRALEILGHPKGDYKELHPNNHVNMAQSTNDVYPTAIKLGLTFAIHDLLKVMGELRGAFAAKAEEFADVLKMGRTQLQDAVPMTLGQEFSTYAVMLGEDESRLAEATALINEINLGATAIGTGINTDPEYARIVCAKLIEVSGIHVMTAGNLIEATQDTGSFVQLSGVLKRIAAKISKICNDLRLLSSGPQAGLNEIKLPEKQAGSSIMPGKVNPVIPEVVNQVAFEVIGNDIAVTMASEAGQLQLNAFEPIMGWSLFKSLKHLKAAFVTLRINCVEGITANKEALAAKVRSSAGLATALNPYLGYENATMIAREAMRTGRPVPDLVLEHGLMDKAKLDSVLSPDALTRPGHHAK
ncbi:aspartate ammonia-lyase [Methylovirgula sp. 4M-Z18]|uniref:aspartate ammonia-lyase n=1 Tax=Methylovirgula sp. 4M-Z18 TaxID=2293567 RepID=UPI000E2ECE3A|nr:aspartate ammonia-lyase [Methylovirgula sp. 4M-Z18]RFB80306.1 aspartate ammonia-lyase [Methylovirgula sp. 4M-Z18]